MPLSDDLDLLEKSIRQLGIEWDKFLGGVERKPPNDMQTKVEGQIRRLFGSEIRNNAERFRYQALTARFNTLNELWQKRLRAREEGRVFGMHGLKAEALPPPRPAAGTPSGPAPPAEYRVSDPARDVGAVRALYERFVQERQRAGEAKAAPSFDAFQKLIGQQTTRFLGQRDARAVDFRLETKDGKVSLKARLVK